MKNMNKMVKQITGCLYALLAISAGIAITLMLYGLDYATEDYKMIIPVMRSPIFLSISFIAAILVFASVWLFKERTWMDLFIGLGLLISLLALVFIFRGASANLVFHGYLDYGDSRDYADALFYYTAQMFTMFAAMLPTIILLIPLLEIVLSKFRVDGRSKQ